MKRTLQLIVLLLFVGLTAGPALADDLYVFPSKGQSQEQMERDKYDCYQWAKRQTGFDPMQRPQATAPPPAEEPAQGGVFRGAARGAAVGAVAGGIARDDAGKGAAAGAVGGAMIGGMRRRDQQRRQEYERKQWEQQQAAQYNQRRGEYVRAYGACLEGKGYNVK
jgi:hypothetical protein